MDPRSIMNYLISYSNMIRIIRIDKSHFLKTILKIGSFIFFISYLLINKFNLLKAKFIIKQLHKNNKINEVFYTRISIL